MYAQIEWKDRYVTIAALTKENFSLARPDTSAYTVLVWQDNREDAGTDIYAQCLDNTTGLALWLPIDGVPVCTESDDQINPRAAYDQDGGVIITWEDYRSGTAEIYAHRIIIATGEVDANWSSSANGVAVCSGTNYDATRPRIVGTGDGAYIAWTDARNKPSPSSSYTDIYAQYVDGYDGSGRWTSNGIMVNQSTRDIHRNAELVLDAPPQSGVTPGIIVAWEDARNDVWQIYAQRIDESGSAQWGSTDVRVAATRYNQLNHQIAQDIAVTSGTPDGPVITWEDSRTNSTKPDIYVQQVYNDGTPLWPTNNGDGLAVCTANASQKNPKIAFNTIAVVAWEDKRDSANTGTNVYAGLIDVAGGSVVTNSPWSSNGRAVCTATNEQINIAVSMYADNGKYFAVIGWQDERHGSGAIYIYQRIRVDTA